jgi:metallo-beta-lactamase family protein
MLAKMSYTGPIYGTPATLDMTGLILRDSARLQVSDTERKNRKRQRAGEPPQEALYTPDDAEKILSQLRPVPYQKEFEVAPGIKAIWHDSGHMLGSTSIQLIVEEDGKTKQVVFSGDLGPRSAPILRDFEPFQHAYLVFL